MRTQRCRRCVIAHDPRTAVVLFESARIDDVVYTTCLQFLRLTMSPTPALVSPYRRPISARVSPAAYAARMAGISASITFALPLRSPRNMPGCVRELWRSPLGEFCLPLRFMSAALSAYVPRNRCVGLQHGGLSQV